MAKGSHLHRLVALLSIYNASNDLDAKFARNSQMSEEIESRNVQKQNNKK